MSDKQAPGEGGDPSARAPQAGGGSPPDAALNAEAADAIGSQLRQFYGEMLAAPLPDKFSDLLQALSRSEKKV